MRLRNTFRLQFGISSVSEGGGGGRLLEGGAYLIIFAIKWTLIRGSAYSRGALIRGFTVLGPDEHAKFKDSELTHDLLDLN